MKNTVVAAILSVTLIGCIEIENKAVSFTPMECKKFGDGYSVKWTSKTSILEATPSKVTIRNENDGKIVTLSTESDWVCTALGDEVKL
jgi:hypothetical protein